MRLILRSTVISAFAAALFSLLCQNPLWAQSKFIPSAMRIGTDIYGIGRTFIGEDRQRFEINSDLAISKYFLVADFGIDNIELDKPTYSYSNEGYYFRIGVDVNFMPEDVNNNVIFFGIRYARSFFSDELSWEAKSPYYEVPLIESSNSGLRGSWLELTAGMKVNIWKELFVGYTVHFKFLRNLEGEGILTPYEMPGYGVYESESRIGFNYHIFWRFPFKKAAAFRTPAEEVFTE